MDVETAILISEEESRWAGLLVRTHSSNALNVTDDENRSRVIMMSRVLGIEAVDVGEKEEIIR